MMRQVTVLCDREEVRLMLEGQASPLVHSRESDAHQGPPCPRCGGRTSLERVVVSRPGLPTVERLLARCQRMARWGRMLCAVSLLEEKAV